VTTAGKKQAENEPSWAWVKPEPVLEMGMDMGHGFCIKWFCLWK
jgi:hypothetical protein